ncbi:hypothetical protein KP509_26G046900 [Ceratopteris richardii]|uniref:SAM-dependent MTase RsmB/NOP-type domain-containing protein n=1 Tax=Ceratopteris richardii TaxID=49495 RepID=A0A8T2RNE2_CERRI|nr:hypothetical protein KP509_26G046900 [Ceratopteris richardii]
MLDERKPGFRPQLQFNADVEALFVRVFGTDRFNTFCQALTCPSKYACVRVNTLKTTCQEVLIKLLDTINNAHSFLLSSDGRFCGGKLPLVNHGSDKAPICFEHPLLRDTVIVQGDGPHHIDYIGCSGLLKEVVVSRKCAEAVLRGANVFVPGVLACSGHVEQGDIVAISVALEHPNEKGEWVVGVTRGTVLLSEHGNIQLEKKDRMHCYIGKGRALLSRTGMFRESHGVAVEMVERVYNLPPLHGILEGDIFLQNLPSILTARVLDPQQGEYVLDMCAAPGGKATALAILMKDKGIIVATDRSHNKVMDIKKLAKEMQIECIRAYKVDALKAVQPEMNSSENGLCEKICINRQFLDFESKQSVQPRGEIIDLDLEKSSRNCVPEIGISGKTNAVQKYVVTDTLIKGTQYTSNAKARKEGRRMKNGPKVTHSYQGHDAMICVKGFAPHTFDKVLLDPPCSALGLRPRLFAGEETIEGLRQHANYQRRLFDQAVQLCRPGGYIVYSTCTINPGENEAVLRYALDTYKYLSLVDQNPYLGEPGLTGTLDDGVSWNCSRKKKNI